MSIQDSGVDVIVVGSGAAAMTAAVTAAVRGLSVLLVEKSSRFGGTSATSGGVAFLPNSRYYPKGGEGDSPERVLRYFEAIVGKDRMRPAVMQAFIDNAPRVIEFLEASTVVQFEETTYVDYKSHMDGGMTGGRSVAARAFDGRELGPWFSRLQEPYTHTTLMNGKLMADGVDVYHLMNLTKSAASLRHAAGRFAQYLIDRLRFPRGARLTMGNALMGRLLKAALDAGVTLWHDAPAVRLISENGRVTGIVVNREGRDVAITARRGVVLGTGGFGNDPVMTKKYIPNSGIHETFSTPGVTGDGLRMAQAVGAALGDPAPMFQTFVGTQVSKLHDKDGRLVDKALFLRRDRNKPGFVLVKNDGRRYVNEAWPYNDVTHAMNHTEGAIPSFLVCDHVRLRQFGLGHVRPGPGWARPLGHYLRSGHLIRANTIRELAQKLGIDSDALEETVRRNNEYARTGKDLEFGKGDTAYDRWQGHPDYKPNPNLGPIETAPFYACKFWPGNLGTLLGLLTDERARVLDADKQPIPGLYACGCDMHHMLTGSYAGGGSSIGPGMTFGFIAARDLADTAQA